MKSFYFVGGPRPGHEQEFFRRLQEIGGAPAGWQIFPHASDARALHLVDGNSMDEIHAHLAGFGNIYEHGEIVEIVRRS